MLPTDEGIGEAALGCQGRDAALALLAILHASAVRRLPNLCLRVALQLDTVRHAYGSASTNPVSGQLQCCNRGIARVALGCYLLNVRIVSWAAELKVRGVPVLPHRPGTPLLVSDDHAPLVRSTSIPVEVAVHDRGNGALPIVAMHLDEVSLFGKKHLISIGISHVHGCLATGRGKRVRIPHVPGRAVVPLPATPHRALRAVGAKRSPAQSPACFKALLSPRRPHSRGRQGPVLTGRRQAL